MCWQRALIVIFTLVKVEVLVSAYFCAGSFTRRSTWSWSKEVSFDENIPTSGPGNSSSTASVRKQRRNKYKDFSKVSDHDPLEVLISEAKQKNDQIIAEVFSSVRSTLVTPDISDIPYVQYPDIKGIDVSFSSFYLHLKIRFSDQMSSFLVSSPTIPRHLVTLSLVQLLVPMECMVG